MSIETAWPPGPRAGDPTPLPAGEATRRFLAALPDTVRVDAVRVDAVRVDAVRVDAVRVDAVRVDAARAADTGGAIGAFKRYANTVRLPLPDDARDTPLVPGPALIGRLMRHLLGIGRFGWTYAAGDGRPEAGPAAILRNDRPVPSGGALYPIEAYLAGGSHGFPPGLHHYDRAHHALQLVREGDHRTALLEALTIPPATSPDLMIVFTAVFWRTGVKYGDFAYQLQCQETGALLAQSMVLAEDLGLSARLHLAFDGPLVERLLDLPEGAEGALAVLGLTAPGDRRPPGPRPAPRAHEIIARPAAQVIDPPPGVADALPNLAALHAAATTAPPGPGGPWAGDLREGGPDDATAPGADWGPAPGGAHGGAHAVPLPEPAPARLSAGIGRRRSAPAGYDPAPIAPDAFARILTTAAEGYPSDLADTCDGPVSCEVYAWALRVAGVPPGSYRYDPGNHRLNAVARWRRPFEATGESMGPLPPLTRLALGEAAAVVFLVGDPLEGVERFGDPWYRLQSIESGLVVHRATLAAIALGLTARIHSDVCHHAADTVLGLHGQARRGLSALLVGRPPRRTPTR